MVNKSAKVFKKIREVRDMSLSDVAAKIGCSKQYVHLVETGKYDKPVEYANQFTAALSITKAEVTELKSALLDDYNSLFTF